jgi:metal-responsive CopG/Arc/MetJ family transcriptional regulator
MAKVMVSIPDDLLADIDRRARQRGTTRSGLLQDAARDLLDTDAAAHAERFRSYLAQARDHGGDATAAVRAARRSRP